MTPPFEEWNLDHCRQVLRRRADRVLRDPGVKMTFDASDLVQETLLKATKAAEEGTIPEDLTDERKRLAWLLVVQGNALIDMQRRQNAGKRGGGQPDDLQALQRSLRDSAIDVADVAIDPSSHPEDKADLRERERRTDEAIERLDSPQREILRLRKQHGWTFERIAEELGSGLTPGKVAGHVRRGLKKLEEQLGPE